MKYSVLVFNRKVYYFKLFTICNMHIVNPQFSIILFLESLQKTQFKNYLLLFDV